MESRAIKITSPINKNASMRIIPGHFATNHSHINYYMDMTIMKSRKSEAEAAASILARNYSSNTYVDTIVCMDGCQVIGAYLAEKLSESGIMSLNAHKTMYVVAPELDMSGNVIFRDNSKMMIEGKHCLILVASATTGRTIEHVIRSIKYYGGNVAGVSALYTAEKKIGEYDVNSIFSNEHVPQYEAYDRISCPLCANHQKLDALVNSFGYSKL